MINHRRVKDLSDILGNRLLSGLETGATIHGKEAANQLTGEKLIIGFRHADSVGAVEDKAQSLEIARVSPTVISAFNLFRCILLHRCWPGIHGLRIRNTLLSDLSKTW